MNQYNNKLFKISLVMIILTVGVFSNKTENSLKKLWNTEKLGTLPEDPSNVISILFQRFSNEKEGLNATDFEGFVNCVTGRKECPHPTEKQQEAVLSLTDCKVNTYLSPEKCMVLNECSNETEVLRILSNFNESTDLIKEEDFKELLPIVMYQMQSKLCSEAMVKPESSHSKKPTTVEVWGYGILFVTLISGCSLAGVSVMPLMARDFYQKLLTVLIGLAVGSLAASSVFHLIPQAYGLMDTVDHSDYLLLSLCILLGIWGFFMIERILKVIFTIQKISGAKIPNSTSSQAIVPKSNTSGKEEDSYRSDSNFDCGSMCKGEIKSLSQNGVNGECGNQNGCVENGISCSPNSNNLKLIYASQEQAIKASFGHNEKPEKSHELQEVHFKQGKDSVIATVAWMVIFGDGFHNFIDGVSIGAAFQESILTGISISLAVMCEELPHELGDFAVLLNSGMTMKQALFYNFLSATTCYIGMAIGILIGEFTQNSTHIFALAAGMFLYISLVDMLPEMNETASKAAEKSVSDVIQVLFLQNLGLFLGVFSLFILAYYQDSIMLGG